MSSNKRTPLALRWFCNIIISTCCIFLLYVVLQITTVCSFHTPTASMTPTIQPGECGLVSKLKMGARIFNVFKAVKGNHVEIYRLPGYGFLERGDIIVFNYPYIDSDRKRHHITMNMTKYYCKRAIAVAGDTLEIKDCFYRIRGCPDTLGVIAEQKALRDLISHTLHEKPISKEWRKWIECCPRDSNIGWTLQNMGPLIIPQKGMQINLSQRNYLIYSKYIEWESGRKLEWVDTTALIDGQPVKTYAFSENYCFAAGDHVADSYDSRYFGLVPEKFIVGTVCLLWRNRRMFY